MSRISISPSVLQAFGLCSIEKTEQGEWEVHLPKQLERKDYLEFKKIVHGLRGEWVRSRKAHVFLHDPTQEIEDILATGTAPAYVDNPHSFFPTPQKEVQDMVDHIAQIRDWDTCRVLEPHAGDGRIIQKVLQSCPGASVDYCEIDQRNRELLEELNATCVGHDFLKAELDPIYDFILMNPPFNRREYVKHIQKAFGLLRPGRGTLVTIVPQSSLKDREFTDWAFGHEGWAFIYPGEHQFEDTQVRYVTLELTNQSDPVVDGYESWGQFRAELALDNDYLFHQGLKGIQTLEKLRQLIERTVSRLVVSGNTLSLKPSIMKPLMETYQKQCLIKT